MIVVSHSRAAQVCSQITELTSEMEANLKQCIKIEEYQEVNDIWAWDPKSVCPRLKMGIKTDLDSESSSILLVL